MLTCGVSLVLIGPPGAGKSTVGKRLAKRLALPFVDSDDAIEDAAGYSAAEMFERYGEADFREIADMVARVCPAAQVHFLPFDLDGVDRAMQEGRSPVELGSSRLAAGLQRLCSAVHGSSDASRERRPLRARRTAQTVSSR